MKHSFTMFGILAAPFLAAVAASGQTAWYPPSVTANEPLAPDLVLYDGEAHTIMVQIVNLTPYQINFVRTPEAYTLPGGQSVRTLDNRYDRTGIHSSSAFLFAPVGVPDLIPGAPTESFADLYPPCYENEANCADNTASRPYSMLFSWHDYSTTPIPYSSVYWTIQGVSYQERDASGKYYPATKNVTLGLFMSRINPSPALTTGYAEKLVQWIKIAIDSVKVASGSWQSSFTLVKEIANLDVFHANQKASDNGIKMYVSAYPVPDMSTPCYTTPGSGCYASTYVPDVNTKDAVVAGWPYTIGGRAQEEITVTTHLLRGKKATFGSLPVVMVTVMRSTDYAAAVMTPPPGAVSSVPGGGVNVTPDVRANFDQLRHLLEKHGLTGIDALKVAIGALTPDQRVTLREMLSSLLSGGPITNQQRQFLHQLIVDLRHLLNEEKEG